MMNKAKEIDPIVSTLKCYEQEITNELANICHNLIKIIED